MLNAKAKRRSALEDKLFTVQRKTNGESHIKIDPKLCKLCLRRICTYICPAEVYEWIEAEEKIYIRYENCLECGTCRIACEMQSIEWKNPSGGAGILYKNS